MTLANLSPALASATGCALHSSNCTSQTRSAYPRSHTARNSPRLQCDHSAKWHACPASVSPHRSRRRTWCRAAAGDDSTADGSPEEALSQSTRSAMHSLSQQSRAGSDYGEGFLQLRLTGETTHLDVDTLNERLQVQGAERMRHHMCPDEAFGMVFNLDNVIANTKTRQQAAWHRLAQLEGLPPPRPDRPLFDLRPERVITEVLQWTRDWGWARKLAWKVAGLYAEEFREIREPLQGVREWLAALARCNIPCAVVSSMDRASTRQALEQMQLWDYFQAQVTAEDGMENAAQCFLSAALKLGRPPNKCVVFDSSPAGVTAAHNCTMKAVAIQGAHPGYRLKQADLTCSNMMELSVYNLRRLFANRGNEFMDADKLFTGEQPPGSRWPRISSALVDP